MSRRAMPMSETPTPPGPSEPLHPEVRFERSDANVNGILIFAVALAVLVLTTVGGMWLLLMALSGLEQAAKRSQDYWTARTGEEKRFPRPPVYPASESTLIAR